MGERHAMNSLRAVPNRDDEAPPREVLEKCKARDATAFRAFVVHYERVVFAAIARIAGAGSHVEDLAQETFLRAYRAFPAFDVDGAARVSTWLVTIAARLAQNAQKHASHRKNGSLLEASHVRDPTTPETERARRELGRAIARAAEDLPVDQRAAFVLAEFHGFSLAEIAAALEIPEGTVKTRLFRARAHLRERLAAFDRHRGDGQ
jgi:RNA polymerase sigma-70 factor (ECF subfamily)